MTSRVSIGYREMTENAYKNARLTIDATAAKALALAISTPLDFGRLATSRVINVGKPALANTWNVYKSISPSDSWPNECEPQKRAIIAYTMNVAARFKMLLLSNDMVFTKTRRSTEQSLKDVKLW